MVDYVETSTVVTMLLVSCNCNTVQTIRQRAFNFQMFVQGSVTSFLAFYSLYKIKWVKKNDQILSCDAVCLLYERNRIGSTTYRTTIRESFIYMKLRYVKIFHY